MGVNDNHYCTLSKLVIDQSIYRLSKILFKFCMEIAGAWISFIHFFGGMLDFYFKIGKYVNVKLIIQNQIKFKFKPVSQN